MSASCTLIAGMASSAKRRSVDGTKIPIEVKSDKKDWAWRVAGIVVDQQAITEHVKSRAHRSACRSDASIARQPCMSSAAGDRIACKLSGGGLAFLQIAADGNASLELALDPASAAARGELVTPEKETRAVRDLEESRVARRPVRRRRGSAVRCWYSRAMKAGVLLGCGCALLRARHRRSTWIVDPVGAEEGRAHAHDHRHERSARRGRSLAAARRASSRTFAKRARPMVAACCSSTPATCSKARSSRTSPKVPTSCARTT